MDWKVSLLAACLVANTATAQTAVPEATIDWRSRADNDITLANEIAALYLTLFNAGNLAVREEEITAPAFVELLLREQGVMLGAHFPIELDAILCDLNPDVCKRSLTPVSARVLTDPLGHIGGYQPSQGGWALQDGDTVTIPDYTFRPVTTLTRTLAPAGWSPEQFDPAQGMDCSAWGISCADVVARFNPRILKAPSRQTTITVPQVQWETTLPLRPDDASELLNSLQDLQGIESAPNFEVRNFDAGFSYSTEWNNTLQMQSPADLTLDAIKDNLRPMGTIEMQSVQDEPMVGDQIDLFKIIQHPFAELEDLGDNFLRPVDVIVIDAPLQNGHCDLPLLRSLLGADIVPPDADPAETCDEIDPTALSDADHAAAVAGLIAAPQNGKGTLGLNPNARLWMMGLDRNLAADQQIQTLIRRMLVDIPTDVRVANLSFGMRPLLTNPGDMANALAIHESRLLIVAAAGNEGLALGEGNCPILPACLNYLENVITVVGLNSDMDNPELWTSQASGSNGNPRFDIGAPAENVLTTVTGNRFALQQGTSFAAPQVTAVASLIFAAGEFIYGDDLDGGQIAPKIVKDRLSYSADFFPGLSGDVRNGRLNVARAINLSDAQFTLFDGRRIVGQVITAPEEFVCRSAQVDQQFRRWFNLRRLSWNPAKQRHFLFRHTGDELGGRYGPLERDASCLLRTLSAPVEVVTRDANGNPTTVAFEFKDILDYTSPLFDE